MKSHVVSGACALLLATMSCASKPAYNKDGGSPGTGGAGTSTGTGGAGTGGAIDECGGTNGLAGQTGAGGEGGAGGVGGDTTGGGGAGPLTITSTEFGEFNNAFMITPCKSPGTGYDCPNLPLNSASCATTPWSFGSVQTSEATGNTYNEVFTVSGGDPSKVYAVEVQVVGQAEGRTYTGGTRQLTTNVDPNATSNDLLYTGGRPGTSRVDYNVFQLLVSPPKCTPGIPSEPTYYAFNAVDTAHEGMHFNYAIASEFTFKVKSGYTVTLTNHDSNCIAIKNCGAGVYNFATAAACEAAARETPPEVTLPAIFRGQTITSPTRFQTQFLNFKVLSITAE